VRLVERRVGCASSVRGRPGVTASLPHDGVHQRQSIPVEAFNDVVERHRQQRVRRRVASSPVPDVRAGSPVRQPDQPAASGRQIHRTAGARSPGLFKRRVDRAPPRRAGPGRRHVGRGFAFVVGRHQASRPEVSTHIACISTTSDLPTIRASFSSRNHPSFLRDYTSSSSAIPALRDARRRNLRRGRRRRKTTHRCLLLCRSILWRYTAHRHHHHHHHCHQYVIQLRDSSLLLQKCIRMTVADCGTVLFCNSSLLSGLITQVQYILCTDL